MTLNVLDTHIKCEDVVKWLGVDIDYQLYFIQHISNLCWKAGQSLNVLKRLSPFLSNGRSFHFFILSFYLTLIIAPLLGSFV